MAKARITYMDTQSIFKFVFSEAKKCVS